MPSIFLVLFLTFPRYTNLAACVQALKPLSAAQQLFLSFVCEPQKGEFYNVIELLCPENQEHLEQYSAMISWFYEEFLYKYFITL